jgi:hypothetical protein
LGLIGFQILGVNSYENKAREEESLGQQLNLKPSNNSTNNTTEKIGNKLPLISPAELLPNAPSDGDDSNQTKSESSGQNGRINT